MSDVEELALTAINSIKAFASYGLGTSLNSSGKVEDVHLQRALTACEQLLEEAKSSKMALPMDEAEKVAMRLQGTAVARTHNLDVSECLAIVLNVVELSKSFSRSDVVGLDEKEVKEELLRLLETVRFSTNESMVNSFIDVMKGFSTRVLSLEQIAKMAVEMTFKKLDTMLDIPDEHDIKGCNWRLDVQDDVIEDIKQAMKDGGKG